MPVLADDDVVVHRDTEGRGDVDDRFRHLDVCDGVGSPEGWLCIKPLSTFTALIHESLLLMRIARG